MSIDSFDTLVEHFSSQYTTSRSHHMTFAALASLRKVDDESLWKFMDRFGHIIVLIQNLNPKVALQSMLLALWPGKFMDNLCKKKKTLVAWTSCANEPKATSRWKRCPSSEMRSDKLDKSMTREKEVPTLTHTSQTKDKSQTNARLSQKDPGTSVTHP